MTIINRNAKTNAHHNFQIEDAESLLHEDFNRNVFEPDSFIFKPVVDSYSATPFLAADPLEMLKRGHFHKGTTHMTSVLTEGGVGSLKSTLKY